MIEVGVFGLLLPAAAPLPLAWCIASRLNTADQSSRLMATALWWCVLACALPVALGWLGWFSALGFMLGNFGFVAVAVSLLWTGRIPLPTLVSRPEHRFALIQLALHQRQYHAFIIRPEHRSALILAGVLLGGLMIALPILPSDNWDTHMYQLPIVAAWLETGSFTGRPAQWLHDPTFLHGILYYPGAWNALFGEALALAGHGRWCLYPNLAAAILLGLGGAATARLLGARSSTSALAGVITLGLPVVHVQIHSAHVDLPFAAVVVAALVAAVQVGCATDDRTRGGWTATWVAAIGLALGIKQSGLWLAPILGLTLLISVIVTCGIRPWLLALTRAPGILLIALVLGGLLSLPWYVRNLFETGNPTGFVRMFGLPGVIDQHFIAQTTLARNFHLANPHHWLLVAGALVANAWPAVTLGLALWWSRSGWASAAVTLADPQRRARFVLVGSVLAILVWLHWTGPWTGKHAHEPDLDWWLASQFRYAIAGLTLAVALVVSLGDHDERWLGGIATAAVVSAPCWWPSPAVAWVGLLGLAVMVIVALALAWNARRVGLACAALAVVAGTAAWATTNWRQGQRQGHFGFAGSAAVLDAIPVEEPLAAWGTHHAWMLMGERGQRRLVWPELQACANADEVVAAVRATGCRWLVIGETVPRNDSRIAEFISWKPEVFRPVHGALYQWGIKVWEVVPVSSPSP